jgi:hypothetical protein
MNEFLYHLRDTIVLLGGRIDIADRLLVLELLDESDVDALRLYNIGLLDSTKERLVSINKVSVQAATDSSPEENISSRTFPPH